MESVNTVLIYGFKDRQIDFKSHRNGFIDRAICNDYYNNIENKVDVIYT